MAPGFLRRLGGELKTLRAELPPNFLWPPNSEQSDITSLDVLLAGPIGTPYSIGVWRLHLDIPHNYPSAPPTATFRTQLWHPNIDPKTGAVCVETLKRDWKPELKLRDVLVTISCLLIQPNPASALNEEAGKLANEDWDAFCRRAKLMSKIHALVPPELSEEVREAQNRGEDKQDLKPDKNCEAKIDGIGEGSEKANVAPGPVTKKKSMPHQELAEDEENARQRAQTVEPESEDGDWIPGPKTPNRDLGVERANVLGIKGLDDSMQVDSDSPRAMTGPKVVLSFTESGKRDKTIDDHDPILAGPATRSPLKSFSLNVDAPKDKLQNAPSRKSKSPQPSSQQNPSDPHSRTSHPLKREFSLTWEESDILNGGQWCKSGETAAEIRKRMSSDEFQKKQKWEWKRFKQAGYDLDRYNRGDFGPRTGIYRL